MSNIQTEYKQALEYVNVLPKKYFKISQITNLTTTRYNPDLPKTDNPTEFLKRPIRYSFSVYARDTKQESLPYCATYIYDLEKDAKIAYKQIMETWIDQQIEPYRKLIEKGNKLTPAQIEKCKQIQDLLPED